MLFQRMSDMTHHSIKYYSAKTGVGKGRGIAQIPPPRILGQVIPPPKFSTDFIPLPPQFLTIFLRNQPFLLKIRH